MHPLHEYVAEHLAEKLKSRKIVVWYDVRSEFAPFVAEIRGGGREGGIGAPVGLGANRRRRCGGTDA